MIDTRPIERCHDCGNPTRRPRYATDDEDMPCSACAQLEGWTLDELRGFAIEHRRSTP